MNSSIITFNSGEISPQLRYRIDLEKHAGAASRLENFLALPYGSITKRPGLRWLAAASAAGANSKAFPFQSTDGSRYILHFTAGKLTIYRPAGTVAATLDLLQTVIPGTPPSPLTVGFWDAPLRDLHLIAINDVAILTHPSVAPLRLTRLGDTSWTIEFLPFSNAPTRDENLNPETTITVLANPVSAAWAAGQAYTVGQSRVSVNAEWVVTTAHTSTFGNEPGKGTGWKSFWRRRLFLAGEAVTLSATQRTDTAWADTLRLFQPNEIVPTAGPPIFPAASAVGYLCISQHRNGLDSLIPSTSSPTQGNWRTIYATWAITDPFNDIDDGVLGEEYVLHNSAVYRCISSHSALADTEPGVGVDWETVWELVDAFSEFSVSTWTLAGTLAVGTRIAHLGRSFTVTSSHAPSATTEPGVGANGSTVYSETSLFQSGHAAVANVSPGSYWQVSPSRDVADFQVEIPAISASDGGFSPIIAVDGGWNLNTFGIWYGTFTLQRSIDNGGTWETIRSYQATGDRNVADSGIEDTPVLMRIGYAYQEGGSALNQRAVLTPELPTVRGTALATAYVSASKVTGTAVSSLLSGQTDQWAEGAFSSLRGFPAAVALHEKRLTFGGTTAQPSTLWLSASDDLTNFETGTDDDRAITATLATPALAPIRWIVSQRRLIIGTSRGEWIAGSETSDAPLTPSNFVARSFTAFGTIGLQPVAANDAILFVERKGSRVRELSYTPEAPNEAGDLTRLAEHLTQPGVAALAWQQTREPGLWAITRAGNLLHLAYSRTERLAAWSQHNTRDGIFRDVIVLPSDTGDDDVFFIVDRGATSHLERFPAHWLETLESSQIPGAVADPPWPWFYLDGIAGSGTSITVPLHFRNVTLTLLTMTGSAIYPAIGSVSYPTSPQTIPEATWQLGMEYAAIYNSLPLDVAAQDGSTVGRRRRLHKVRLNVWQSRGGMVWNARQINAQLIFRPSPAQPLASGWHEVTLDPGNLDETTLNVIHAQPFPITLRAASLAWNLQEP